MNLEGRLHQVWKMAKAFGERSKIDPRWIVYYKVWSNTMRNKHFGTADIKLDAIIFKDSDKILEIFIRILLG